MATRKSTAPQRPQARARKAKEPQEVEYREVFPGKNALIQLTGHEPPPVETTPIEVVELGLTATSVPGVYKNRMGVLVDGDGVMINHAELKSKDQERFERIVGGPVDSPAKLLKAVALDPQLPLNTRLAAAVSAAPYFDRKRPIGIDGGEDGKPIQIEHIHKLSTMSKEELDKLEGLLQRGLPAVIEQETENVNDA